MNPVGGLFGQSIGKKLLMAVTGVILMGFITGHLIGNLQIFEHPDRINGYAHFLQSLGPVLWAVRLGLLACVMVHIWVATLLTLENWRARPEKYDVNHTIRATLSSRTMRVTGLVVLAFILYHLAHFTVGWVQAGTFKRSLPEYVLLSDYHALGVTVVAAGTQVLDVHAMMVLGFQSVLVSLFYIVAVGLLSFHLLHGAESMFQTFGWNSGRWAGVLRKLVLAWCVLYFLGNLAIPGAVLVGAVKPNPPAAAVMASPSPASR
ncbi:MAG: succinate dehydrogenase [Verrucomicrobia bacterium RIFCSPLOWO2_12_FULL_64_8]|nr:MAG: succinate dehydrogenase [Verrucomicrobia bacterium RIFCSPLOWO2_12_FULL_64_8]